MKRMETVTLRPTLAWIVLATACIALACSTPTPPGALTQAQAAYQKAAADPAIKQEASVELYEAEQALDRAQSEWNKTHDQAETEHLAYLANRRVEMAQRWASGRVAAKKTRSMAEQAQSAQAELKSAKQEAATATAAAAEAAAREKKLREEMASLEARETARGLEMTLGGDILFDTGKSELKPGAMQNLYPLATFLRDHPDRAVLVEGHTDSTGSDSVNQPLSEKRAEAVRSFLVGNGIAPGRVLARGYGKAYPLASNDTTAGRLKNRRVDVVILHPGESPEGKLRAATP